MERTPKREHLSLRERQIAEAYAAGRSYREIAERLFIAPATVRTHLGTVYRKLGVSTKIELLRTLETADGPDAEAGVEEFAPSPETAREPRADPALTELLRELDLHQYANVFAANAVDRDILMTLTDSDLRELGVQAIGHRRGLLNAIHERRSDSVRADGVEGGASEEVLPARATGPLAERRHLTIAFVDLAGSMELSTQLDPEQTQELLADYQKAVAKEAARFQGHLANVMGDEILVSFGWPNAHEGDAERAVWASLAIRAAIEALRGPPGNPLAVRIGIASGLVVVGEGINREAVLAGDAPNLASRLRAIASPGQIVIAESTRRLLSDILELADLGTKSVRGLGEPVQAFAVIDERSVESRFDARSGSALLPMVGRDQELALLLERWAQAKAGEGQGVLLVGEAGIGKSRIVRALLDAVAEEPHSRIRYQCSPYHSDSALWPVIQQLTHAAGIKAADPDEAKLDKLEALLRQAGDHALEGAPLIAHLIGLDGAPRYGQLELTPQAQRARTLQALVGQLLGLAASQPVLMVLEDAHWIDPTTVELIEQCLDRTTDARAMILLTSRPDRQPELAAHPHVTRLTLNRLGRAGVEAMVVRLGGEHLPGDVIGTIIARTDGVPLFVEELTKAVLETGEATVPASLHDSLMGRLDRIPEVKEVARIAACIGRGFDFSLLACVADHAEPDLLAALDKLARSELIFRRSLPPNARYTFKHTLVRDAAYQSLLKSRRQQVHARIAEALEQEFPDVGMTEPEVLAHHWCEAGNIDKALQYLRGASARAVERSANTEAAAHLRAALELVQEQPPSDKRWASEAALWLALGAALTPRKGYAADEVREAFTLAEQLCRKTGDREQLFLSLRGLWNCHLLRTELREASALAEQIFELAQQFGTAERMLVAHRVMATSLLYLGRIEDARQLFTAGLAFWDPELSADYTVAYGEDPGLFCCVYAARCDDFVGFRDEALVKLRRALDHARGQPNRYGLAVALAIAATVHQFRREPERVASLAQEGIELCREQRIAQWLAYHHIFRGWALAVEGHHADGLSELREGMAAWQGIKMQLSLPYFCILLAQAHAAAGQIDAALQALERGDGLVVQTGHETFEVLREHQWGELLLLRASAAGGAQAERQFVRCLELARRQGCRTIQLRAATSLARLWAEQGRRADAHDLLAPVYEWFTEGFDTADLKDAKALLDELR